MFGEPGVGVQRMMIHRDHAKEVVVGLGDRLAGPVFVHVADLELLEVTTEGTFERTHGSNLSHATTMATYSSTLTCSAGRVVNDTVAPGNESPSITIRHVKRAPSCRGIGPQLSEIGRTRGPASFPRH